MYTHLKEEVENFSKSNTILKEKEKKKLYHVKSTETQIQSCSLKKKKVAHQF